MTETEIGVLLTEIERLRGEVANLEKWREHVGMLRDVVESIGVGGCQMTKREEVLRGQCRLLVRAFDEGVL